MPIDSIIIYYFVRLQFGKSEEEEGEEEEEEEEEEEGEDDPER